MTIQIGDRFKSQLTGAVGTVVEITEVSVKLDFSGNLRFVKISNLSSRYTQVGTVIHEEDKEEEKELDKKANEQATKIESSNDYLNNLPTYTPPESDTSTTEPLFKKMVVYLKSKGCKFLKRKEHTNCRLGARDCNFIELYRSKSMKSFRIQVRSEAFKDYPEIFNSGYLQKIQSFEPLDLTFRFVTTSNVNNLYRILNIAIEFEKTRKRGVWASSPRDAEKRGINKKYKVKEILSYKRELFDTELYLQKIEEQNAPDYKMGVHKVPEKEFTQ